ncbi:hypothetical protein SAMN05428971_2472 [Candidatus Pantoea varia]|uniref:Uncharacterized protein n=1 Tax=Candidatus Pantoea varia TaxID=1881036 RepID=A0A1I5CUS3_9GAMM|nr:hypothetical protein [Pantoea varia]SFN90616.1 hypothetical protein SAMN05428971_2472 [Pantoea varia]
MAKNALSVFIKIALFATIMLIVAKVVPYDGFVNSITALFDFKSAQRFTHFILGEPDLETWESLKDYFSLLINTLISIPVMSAVITFFNGVTLKIRPAYLPKEWTFSTLRRLVKAFAFTFIFWVLFRFLPYDSFVTDEHTFSAFTLATLVVLNLLLTIACYCFITKKMNFKKSL